MNFTSSASILTYVGVLCFTTTKMDAVMWEDIEELLGISNFTIFILLLFIFFTIKFVIDTSYENLDEVTANLLSR
jgi:hypothetical protein